MAILKESDKKEVQKKTRCHEQNSKGNYIFT